jgi:hypothetical protein
MMADLVTQCLVKLEYVVPVAFIFVRVSLEPVESGVMGKSSCHHSFHDILCSSGPWDLIAVVLEQHGETL